MDDYLDWLRIERGLSPNTIMAYQRDLIAFMCSLPQSHDLSDVDEKCVIDWLARRLEQEQASGLSRGSSYLSEVFLSISLLKSFWNATRCSESICRRLAVHCQRV